MTRRASWRRDFFNAFMKWANGALCVSRRPTWARTAAGVWTPTAVFMRFSFSGTVSGRPGSPLHDHGFQILTRHDHCAVVRLVHAGDEIVDIFLQCVLLPNVEGCECLEGRTIEGPEHIDEVLGRPITEVEMARLGLDPGSGLAEHFGQAHACPPEQRRFCRRGWRDVFAERLEQMADKAVRRPIGQADLTARPADAQEL